MATRIGVKGGKRRRLAPRKGRHMMPGMEGMMRDEDMPVKAAAKRKKKRRKGPRY